LKLPTHNIDDQLEEAEIEAKKDEEVEKARKETKSRKAFKGEHVLPDALLGVFDWMPNELVEGGFTPETLRMHDIGYDKRNDRITFPIRDLFGNLIGISGRATNSWDQPKYLIYNGRRTVDGKEVMGELGEWYPDYTNEGIRDHLWGMEMIFKQLYNERDPQLIIVEGYKAKMWMVQHGWLNTVALMGSDISPGQERVVRSIGPETIVLLDNDKPGRYGARKICQTLAVGSFPVYCCHYPAVYDDEDVQPDDLAEEELEQVLCSATRTGGKRYGGRVSRR
jgi:Toprim domain/DNA primase catalytic core, N-terminal domain